MNKLKIYTSIFKEIKWVFTTLHSYIMRVVFYAIVVLVKTLLDLYLTYQVGGLVDYILTDDMNLLIRTVTFFGIIVLIDTGMAFYMNRLNARNYTGMHKELFMKVYEKTLKTDWETLTLHSSGDLLTRISADVKTVTGNANGLFPTVLAELTMIIGAVSVIIYYDPTILMIVLIVVPIVLVATRIFMGKQYRCYQDIKQIESEIMSFNKETFHNMQAVKAFNLAANFTERMEKKAYRLLEANMKSNLYAMLSWCVSKLSGMVTVGICGAWILYRMHTNVLSFGNVAAMVALAVQIAASASALLGLLPTILEFTASSSRIKEIMNMPDEEVQEISDSDRQKLQKGTKEKISISVKDMSFHYQNAGNVFERVSMHASAGEIIALVGPSGEGKTTMLRILLGIVTAQSGTTELQWEDGSKIKMGTEMRPLISYVPQGNTMMSGSIADNMRMICPDASDSQIIEALKLSCAYDFVKKLPDGINHEIGESGLGFSEGQNQRLAIARAVLRNTPILLLDEATSALDVVTERKVLSNLMKEDEKRICILTTHRPSALNMCNRVYRISNKSITEIGEKEITELMNEF